MKELEIISLEQNIATIRNYLNEIECIERFLKSQDLNIGEEDKAVFWNHFVSLFDRVDKNEMNSLEIDFSFEPSVETLLITKLLISELKVLRNFEITEFEEVLIVLYMQKLIDKRST